LPLAVNVTQNLSNIDFCKQELLYGNHLSIDGSKIEETGFEYNCPELTVEALREVAFYFFLPRCFLVLRCVTAFFVFSNATEKKLMRHKDEPYHLGVQK